ncbi:hypothetical protein [Mangrovibrevibacter kandeliae]|uniref:hypothetical protein n=1 Tax=Mangrovibrevibacter kandeliae TaxID=2968473 RepID=UPI002118B1F5|nr:hypothetical protein [Aurantimonas sp. CSK15Z-1]MCQ8780894.1 hypothetical protein [Aurantimonas sp. CSK15Z-1]
MSLLRAALAAPLLGLMAGTAAAAPAFPDAAYGDKDGCAYAKTGESSGSDTFFLLDREGVTTAASYCELKGVKSTGADTFDLKLSCEAEGEDATEDHASAKRSGRTVTLHFADGTTWGPLTRCK